METIEDEDGKDLYDACFSNKIRKEEHQFFLCAHEDHDTPGPDLDRKKRSADEKVNLSRSKRGGHAGDINDLMDYTAIYCPKYLPNSCASADVSILSLS